MNNSTVGVSVAIVDDDPIYQFAARRILEFTSMTGEIHQFMSGEPALEYILKNKDNAERLPDILLLDLNMPIVDGWMFLDSYQKIKNTLAKNILIYMVTSSIDVRDISQAKTYPEVRQYLSKPLDIDFLKGILSEERSVIK